MLYSSQLYSAVVWNSSLPFRSIFANWMAGWQTQKYLLIDTKYLKIIKDWHLATYE